MQEKFVIITEIFYKDEKISRKRSERYRLSKLERNQIIESIFNRIVADQNMKVMDKYAYICAKLEEEYKIKISERTVMRAVNYKPFFDSVKNKVI